jgi:hypothetical protein
MGDEHLDIRAFRGYMLRYKEKPDRTPENPELYICTIALSQPKQWQDLIWTKEILQILDRPEFRTTNKESLGHMMDNRETIGPHGDATPPNVGADRDGITLALGCAIPLGYRKVLREQEFLKKYTIEQLESQLLIPSEFIEWLLSDAFEQDFEIALARCDFEP